MTDATETKKTWDAKYEYFKDFANYQGWEHIKDFCAIVAQIRDSPYSSLVYASTSHAHLNISQYDNPAEAIQHAGVTVIPYKNEVKIEYHSDTGQMLETSICGYDGAWRNLVRIMERLLKTIAQ